MYYANFPIFRQKTGEKRDDFLQILLEARSENGKVEITDDIIIAQALLFILGGFDTVEILLSCALYELALNPEVQAKLYREIKEASLKEGGLNYENINSCEYLNMVVSGNEILPPFRRFFRGVLKFCQNEALFLQRPSGNILPQLRFDEPVLNRSKYLVLTSWYKRVLKFNFWHIPWYGLEFFITTKLSWTAGFVCHKAQFFLAASRS